MNILSHIPVRKIFQQIFLRNLTAENIRITFVDVTEYIAGYRLETNAHLTQDTFYRFLILEILKHHQKVLYLDCDIIVCDDLAKLYDTELGDYLIGATSDADSCGSSNKKDCDSFFVCTKCFAYGKSVSLFSGRRITDECRKAAPGYQCARIVYNLNGNNSIRKISALF